MRLRKAWLGGLLAAGLLVVQAAYGQTGPPSRSSTIERIARQANMVDSRINNTAVKMKTFTHGGQSGLLSLYTGALRTSKLVVQLVSPAGGDVNEYYYMDGSLIYVVQACKPFVSSSSARPKDECRTISEDRFYLSGGKLVAWLRGTGAGSMEMHPVTTDRKALARKLTHLERSASLWMAFLDSPISNFDHFESDRRFRH